MIKLLKAIGHSIRLQDVNFNLARVKTTSWSKAGSSNRVTTTYATNSQSVFFTPEFLNKKSSGSVNITIGAISSVGRPTHLQFP